MRRFNFGELMYFLTLCFLNLFLIYLILSNRVDFYVGQKMIIYVYFAIFMISIMIIFQFSKIFTIKTYENISLKCIPLIVTLIIGIISMNSYGNFKHILLNKKYVSSNDNHKYNIYDYLKSINNKNIVINDDNAEILEDITQNFKKYLGYKITIDGFVCKDMKLEKNQFILEKVVVRCCRADADVFGIVVQYDNIKKLNKNQKVTIQGSIGSTKINDKKKEYNIPIIMVDKLE